MKAELKIHFSDQELWLLKERAIWWPLEKTLIVSDLHLGKSLSFASHGICLPPYDIRETLYNLQGLLRRYHPEQVICLGDNFHRENSYQQLAEEEKNLLHTLIHSVPVWCWIYGNHDNQLPYELQGDKKKWCQIKEIAFFHELLPAFAPRSAIIGHFHPKYTLKIHRHRISKPCFAWNKRVMIMPAFGSFTGGLDINHQALKNILGPTFQIATADTDPHPLLIPIGAST